MSVYPQPPAQAQAQVVPVQIPPGVGPGQQFLIRSPQGQQVAVTVPLGLGPGMIMYVRIPAPPPMPMVMVTPPAPNDPPPEVPADIEISDAKPTWASERNMAEAPNPEDLQPCMACCCVISSCYFKAPQCCGYYAKGNLTCFEIEGLCCKTGAREGSICVINKNECECIQPTTCIKCESQMCCIDERCAFPCDAEVPCMLAVCGFTCVQDYKFVCEFGSTMR